MAPGYHELLAGHGKVFDADTSKEVEGCHGSLNCLLCLSNEVIADRCAWNRKNTGVSVHRQTTSTPVPLGLSANASCRAKFVPVAALLELCS